MLSVCGASCDGCAHVAECGGTCEETQGRVFWAKYLNLEVCPLYQCVRDHGYKDCGDCAKLPCETWFAIRDPAATDEQHRKSIDDHAAKLRSARFRRENPTV